MRSKTLLSVFVGVLTVGLIVTACGGSDPTATPRPTNTPAPPTAASAPQPTATPRPTNTPASPTPAGPSPQRGGTLRMHVPIDPAGLDPTKLDHYAMWFSMDEIWSNLVQFKSDFYEQAELIGDMAERWEISPDGKSYTFFLNPNARWQNRGPERLRGRQVTADDWKWTLETLLDPDYGSRHGVRLRGAGLETIEATGPAVLVLNLKKPANNFLFEVGFVTTKVHAKELLEDDLLGTKQGIVGTGAFTFDKLDSGSLVRMTASDNYWVEGADGGPLPYLDALEVMIIADVQTQVAAVQTGQSSLFQITGLSQSLVRPLRGNGNLTLQPSHAMFQMLIHWQNETIDKPFRKALLMGTNVGLLLRSAIQNPDAPLESYVHVGVREEWRYPDEKLQQWQKYDPDAATAEIKRLGLEGTEITIHDIFQRAPYSLVAQALESMYRQIGLDPKIGTNTASEGQAIRAQGNYEVAVASLSLSAHPTTMLDTGLVTGRTRNFLGYSNPEFDALVDQVKAELDPMKYIELINQAQDIAWEDAAGLPVNVGNSFQVTNRIVKGFKNNHQWGNQGIKRAWLDKK